MRVLRIYDPDRRPANWTGIVRAGEVAVFARDETDGLPRGAGGERFADVAHATCALFDSVDEARGFCEEAVLKHPALRFDVFDHEGRSQPPLLTIVHPERAGALDESPRRMRVRRTIAWALAAAGGALLLFASVAPHTRDVTFATLVGINMIVAAWRLLFANMTARETERVREERLQRRSQNGAGIR